MDIGGLISDIIRAPFICIGWLIIGFIAGALARRVMGASNQPFINDIILGIIGSFVGGFVVSLLGFYQPDTGITAFLVNVVVATIGAIILIAIGRAIRGQRIA
jgi:uncharacterized membrane protein YeaQ/YmgE (transglycosylase-associated protein family)